MCIRDRLSDREAQIIKQVARGHTNHEIADTFRDERVPSAQRWRFSPDGQHLELGIAEMNLFLLLGAAGLSHSLFGERLIPIGTLYDPFIARGLDALNYACLLYTSRCV